MSREPGDGEGQGIGRKRRARTPRPSPSDLSPAERRERAQADALRLLSHRERSRRELATRLRSRGYDPETVESVLDRLAEAGLQSDGRFAEEYVTSAQRSRGLATASIQGELRRRGIDRELAARAATEPPEAEEDRARALAHRRAGGMRNLTPDVKRRRLTAYLARRGYEPSLCERIAAEAVGDHPADPDAGRLN